MALQYTFQSLSTPHAVIVIKYYIHKNNKFQHPMWQFNKALRLDLYEQDVRTNTAKNIRSLYSNYISEENTSACDFFTRLFS